MEYKMDLVKTLRELSENEYRELEASCLEHGILDDIKVWNGYLLDGRHRMQISKEHGLKTIVTEVELPDMDAAKKWVLQHQLGRRNLTSLEMSYIRSQMAALTGDEETAEQFSVSPATIRRDKLSSKVLDTMPEDVRKKCATGEIMASHTDLRKYSRLSDEEKSAVSEKLRKQSGISLTDALPNSVKNLAPAEYDAVNSLEHLEPQAKRAIVNGDVHADSAAIRALRELPPEKQQLLSTVIQDPEIRSLRQALGVVNGPKGPRGQEEKLRRAIFALRDLIERAEGRLKDLEAIGGCDIRKPAKSLESVRDWTETLL